MSTEHASFVVCLNPHLSALEQKMTGVKTGRRGTKTTVIAYADDVTITVSKPDDIPVMRETLRTYEEASGAKINVQKSKALALGSWNTSVQIMDFPYYEEIKVLGIHIQKNTHANSETELEYADLTGQSAGPRNVPTGTGLRPENTIHP
jgi:hypothetical protein